MNMVMAPECVEMYLELYIFFILAREFVFIEISPGLPIFSEIAKRFIVCEKKSLNNESLVNEGCDF